MLGGVCLETELCLVCLIEVKLMVELRSVISHQPAFLGVRLLLLPLSIPTSLF